MRLNIALIATAMLILGLSLSGSFITGFIIHSVLLCDGKNTGAQRAVCDGNNIVMQECKKDGWHEISRKECIKEKCNEIDSFTAVCGELCKPICKDENTIDSAYYENTVCVHSEIDCPAGYKCRNAECVRGD